MRLKIVVLWLAVFLAAVAAGGCESKPPAPDAEAITENAVPLAQKSGKKTGKKTGKQTDKNKKKESSKKDGSKKKKGSYRAPVFQEAKYHPDEAEGTDAVKIDLSQSRAGYVAAKAVTPTKLKIQVIKGSQTYTYDLPNDGTESVFPLQCGDGDYTVRVMENVTGTKYAMAYQTQASVKLLDEFQPYLRPSAYANYKEDSKCVTKAKELAGKASDANEVVTAVFDYICKSVVYDKEKAKNVTTGYIPMPDETLTSGKGICFDYASLAASMLRSQGIPAKVIFGYVSPNDLYHAWNMFYTKEQGWVTVDYEVKENSWNRLDLTFSANGADGDFIGDGSNYTDVYMY